MKIYIIDDDFSIRKMLENIIQMKNLGEIIGSTGNSNEAIEDIEILQPDIVLIDLLLPEIDGIEIIRQAKETSPNTFFIMISKVFSKDMIAKAYKTGTEYFINKPINVLEAASVIEKVKEKIEMNDIIQSFETAMDNLKLFRDTSTTSNQKVTRNYILEKLSQIGISGVGQLDIADIIYYIIENKKSKGLHLDNLSTYYHYISKKYKKEKGEEIKPQTVKQRVRRCLKEALNTIANIGLEDYYDPIFEKYSSNVFKFSEVRHQMNYIKGMVDTEGAIDIKRFISGIIIIMEQDVQE